MAKISNFSNIIVNINNSGLKQKNKIEILLSFKIHDGGRFYKIEAYFKKSDLNILNSWQVLLYSKGEK